jgi:sarcosine oxidase, subunit beta
MGGLPATAPVVIIGAGCIGASIAYELGRRGVKGVVVIEKEQFAGLGSTSKAAGGIRAQFSTPLSVKMSMMSEARFRTFAEEMETDGPVFWPVGYLFLLGDEKQWATFQRQAEMQRSLGLPVQTLTPQQAKDVVPEMNVDDVLGATFCLEDGLGSPHEVTQAYEKQARRLGAHFQFGETACGLVREGSRVTGVRTGSGTVSTPLVVNAAGPHAAEVASWAGVDLPVVPIRRHCFITEPLAMARADLPMIVDMKSGVYMHRESGGLLLGYANPEEPVGFNLSVNFDLLDRMIEPAMNRVPALEEAEINRKKSWAGLYETTPDHNCVLGPPRGVEGLMLANGFSGHGFMQAPVVGQLISEWIVDGQPSLDLTALRLERFSEQGTQVESNVI